MYPIFFIIYKNKNIMNVEKFDAILYIKTDTINEADDRIYGEKPLDFGWKGEYDSPDYKLLDAYTFGKVVRSSLANLSAGYFSNVIDYGKYVIVTIGYNNSITGRSASKTYLIVFQSKGDGVILSTSNKYRTISGAQQAISYIKSAASVLQNQTTSKSI